MLVSRVSLTPRQYLRNRIFATRWYSKSIESNNKSSNDTLSEEDKKREAAKLAMQSLKDVKNMFGSSSDDAVQPIDTEPIFNDPKLFGSLSLLHQGQVLKELQDKYDKKWHKLNLKEKRLGYYIAYGNWGVREDFNNWNTMEPPLDLPFHLKTVKSVNPLKDTIVKKVDPVILAETPVRIKQFDFKKMDNPTKVFIYLTIFIIMLAIARDKKIGEEGKPTEVIIIDPYEEQRKQRQKELEQKLLEMKLKDLESKKKKWYYLWLK